MLSGIFVLEWMIGGELVGDGFELMGLAGEFMSIVDIVMARP